MRDRFGDEYRVVELPNYVALFPVAEDPIAAVEEAVGDTLEGKSVGELRAEARRKGRAEVVAKREERDAEREERDAEREERDAENHEEDENHDATGDEGQ